MRPRRRCGVGLSLIISLAMNQIFCFAPSIRPDIEPVVSSTKQTSRRGLADLVGFGSASLAMAAEATASASVAASRIGRFVFMVGLHQLQFTRPLDGSFGATLPEILGERTIQSQRRLKPVQIVSSRKLKRAQLTRGGRDHL